MKKIFLIVGIISSFFISMMQVSAADLTFNNDGFESVGENEVHIIYSRLNFETALANNDVTFNGDFAIKKITQHTDEDMSNGTFDTKRNESNDYLTYSSFADGSPVLVYTKSVPVGEQQLPGSVTMRFRNAAIFSDHTYGDLVVTLDNITAKKTVRDSTRPIALLLSVDGEFWFGSYLADQERASNQTVSSMGNIGLAYDVNFNVTKPNSNEQINKKMILSFVDIDIKDNISASDTDQIWGYVDQNGNPLPYVESITLINGANEVIHVRDNYEPYLLISDTEYGENTKFSGKKRINTVSSNSPAGFITRVDSGGFKLRWTGEFCATRLGVVPTAVIETAKVGKYPEKANITPSDDTILWKENKTVEMSSENGYYIDIITIDDVEVPYSSLTKDADGKSVYEKDGIKYNFEEKNGVVTYNFENVIENHIISVSVEKNGNYKIHYDANGGTGTMEDTVAEYDVEGNLSPNTFTREGYEFTGWTAYVDDGKGGLVPLKDKNNKTVTFKDKDKFLNLYGADKKEVTLKANWNKLSEENIITNPPTGMIILILEIVIVVVSSVLSVVWYKRNKNIMKNK